MSDKPKLKDNYPEKRSFLGGLLSLLLKQLIASLICLAIALGMKHSPIDRLNNYATSLGLAIRYNPGWEDTVKEAFLNFKGQEDADIQGEGLK